MHCDRIGQLQNRKTPRNVWIAILGGRFGHEKKKFSPPPNNSPIRRRRAPGPCPLLENPLPPPAIFNKKPFPPPPPGVLDSLPPPRAEKIKNIRNVHQELISEMALQKCNVNFSARILGWIFWCEFWAVNFLRVNFWGGSFYWKTQDQ